MTTLKSEKSVRELAERVYGTSSAAALARAEKALLKANPQLATATGFRAGAVVRVPVVSGLVARAEEVGQAPLEPLRGALADAAADYRAHLAQSLDARTKELDAQEKLLKTREIAAAIKAAPGGVDLQKQLTATLSERAKAIAEARKSHSALFDRIAADLKSLELG